MRAPALFLLLLILLLSARTITYAHRWNDRESFYRYSIANQPKSVRLRMLLIAELQGQRRLDEADAVARDARQLLPEYDEIWLQSADIAEARGDFDRARGYLEHAMKIKPRNKTAMRMQMLDEKRASTQTTHPR
jgi:tetratricopeptide (TPR) repeat protein